MSNYQNLHSLFEETLVIKYQDEFSGSEAAHLLTPVQMISSILRCE